MLVKCTPRIDTEPLLAFVWIIAQMQSSCDTPYHPAICSYPDAFCYATMFECYNQRGKKIIYLERKRKDDQVFLTKSCYSFNSANR